MTASANRAQQPLKHLLAALASDGLSDHAIHAALELRSILSASLEVVHVVRPASFLPQAEAAEADAARLAASRAAAVKHVDELCSHLALTGPRPHAEDLVRVEVGRPATSLAERARASNADLVVVGARQAQAGFGLGGTLRELLAISPCSIWVQSTPVRPIRRILAPIDLSQASLDALRMAVSLAREFQAAITVLHAFDAAQFVGSGWPDGLEWCSMDSLDDTRRAQAENFQAACHDCSWHGVDHTPVFLERNPIRAVQEHAREHDLIVLGTHGVGSALPSALGGTAWSILRSAEIPVLAVKCDAAETRPPGA